MAWRGIPKWGRRRKERDGNGERERCEPEKPGGERSGDGHRAQSACGRRCEGRLDRLAHPVGWRRPEPEQAHADHARRRHDILETGWRAAMTGMAGDISRALDPVMLALDAGIEPDPWQADVLRAQPRRLLMLCSRQAGKSTVSALLALHTALYTSAALVLLVSPSLRQSGELFRVTMGFYQRLKGVVPVKMESALRAEFENGARIVSLPGTEKTTRGFSKATLIVVDEAARCDDGLLGALRPMMATSKDGGRLVMLSTPYGKRGMFYDAWSSGRKDWQRVEVPADQCPRISREFLDEELRQLGPQRFSEEYGLAWLDPTESVFPTELIDAAFTREVTPLWPMN